MENVITINGTEYQNIEVYNKLFEEHQKILNQNSEIPKQRYDGFMDEANVFMFIKFDLYDDRFKGDLIKLNKPKMVFKKLMEYEDAFQQKDKLIFFNEGTKHIYGLSYKKDFDKIISGFEGQSKVKSYEPTIYFGYDEEKKEFMKKEYPMILLYSNYAIVVAPRIETGD